MLLTSEKSPQGRGAYHLHALIPTFLQDGGPLRAVQVQGVLQAVHEGPGLPQDQVRKHVLKGMTTTTRIHASFSQ